VTLVWLAAILTVIVAGAVFATWTVRIHTLKCGRLVELHRGRLVADLAGDDDDRRSREAWAQFRAEAAARAEDLEAALSVVDARERLAVLATPRLEVVA
jgi:hypothetical protein